MAFPKRIFLQYAMQMKELIKIYKFESAIMLTKSNLVNIN